MPFDANPKGTAFVGSKVIEGVIVPPFILTNLKPGWVKQ
jgi:hypothetical protein